MDRLGDLVEGQAADQALPPGVARHKRPRQLPEVQQLLAIARSKEQQQTSATLVGANIQSGMTLKHLEAAMTATLDPSACHSQWALRLRAVMAFLTFSHGRASDGLKLRWVVTEASLDVGQDWTSSSICKCSPGLTASSRDAATLTVLSVLQSLRPAGVFLSHAAG